MADAVGVGFEVGQRLLGVAGEVAGEREAGGLGDEGFDVTGVQVGQSRAVRRHSPATVSSRSNGF
jgi:hypothetical protein